MSGAEVRPESYSALVVSAMRAVHSRYGPDPLINDPYGLDLLSDEEQVAMAKRVADKLTKMGFRRGDGADLVGLPLESILRAHPSYGNVVLRTCYTDDRLEEAQKRGFTQLVLLGAGLDTFVLRRPDLAERLQVFEVDHPASQRMKRRRLAAAGLAAPPSVTYLSVDFELQSVGEALEASSCDPAKPTFFSWLGVSPYLTLQAHEETLGSIADFFTGDVELAFNYVRKRGPGDGAATVRPSKVDNGEPIISYFDPSEVRALLAGCGYDVIEDLGAEELGQRYCKMRRDGLRAAATFRMVHARKAEASDYPSTFWPRP